MKYLVDSHTMKAVDNCSIHESGIPSVVLMERAALGVSAFLLSLIEKNTTAQRRVPEVVCVCGSGNNGADGLAVARQLNENGINVTVVLTGTSEGTEEYRLQYNILRNLGVRIVNFDDGFDFSEYDYIVDAIFGIGLSREVTGRYESIINSVNAAKENNGAVVVSVDIPSGISADDGHISGCAVRADYTVTFGYNKLGIIFYPGASYSGDVTVVNAGFVPEKMLTERVAGFKDVFTFTDEDIKRLIIRREDSNKGTYGKALIIAGSKSIGGAAVLAADAAYRCGAGLVKVFTHEDNRTALISSIPECLISTYGDNDTFSQELSVNLSWAKSIAVGPGISLDDRAASMVADVLGMTDKIRVFDADALNIIARDKIVLDGKMDGGIIITPHLLEMARLTGKTVDDIKNNLIETAARYAKAHGCICVLKDARTVVTDGMKVYVNTSGNNGMSTGGSGDVLTGIIVGLTAQGIDAFDAACLGVYVHGRAGDVAADMKGYAGMTASDIVSGIAYALR